MDDCFQCSTHSSTSHARLIRFIHHLRWQVWNMHKTSLDIAFLSSIMAYAIHQVIAYKGTCRIRNFRRNTSLVQCINNIFNRQCSEVRTRTINYDWFILRLVACIVWNTEIITVNSNTFYCNIRTATGLPHTENKVWLALFSSCFHRINRSITYCWYHLCNDLVITICITIHSFNCFPCRINRFATKRIKTSN